MIWLDIGAYVQRLECTTTIRVSRKRLAYDNNIDIRNTDEVAILTIVVYDRLAQLQIWRQHFILTSNVRMMFLAH